MVLSYLTIPPPPIPRPPSLQIGANNTTVQVATVLALELSWKEASNELLQVLHNHVKGVRGAKLKPLLTVNQYSIKHVTKN